MSSVRPGQKSEPQRGGSKQATRHSARLPSCPLAAGRLTLSPRSISYKDTCHRIRGPLGNTGWPHLQSFNVITSAKALFANKVVVTGSGDSDGEEPTPASPSWHGVCTFPKALVSLCCRLGPCLTCLPAQKQSLGSGSPGPGRSSQETAGLSWITTIN